jgi:ubiquinone biosynthesis protein COQ9
MSKNNYLLDKRLKVLFIAKNIVAKEGFNSKVFIKISKNTAIDENETHLLFPDGYKDLINFALEQLNVELENYCNNLDLIRLPLHKRIRVILLSKILIMNKEKNFYKKLFLNLLLPKRGFSISKQLYNSIDQIWYIAGDTSTDFNFYTKRLILAGIYSRVILFFFNNNNQIYLEKILDTNLQRVAKIPQLKSKINIFKNNFPSILKFIKNFN